MSLFPPPLPFGHVNRYRPPPLLIVVLPFTIKVSSASSPACWYSSSSAPSIHPIAALRGWLVSACHFSASTLGETKSLQGVRCGSTTGFEDGPASQNTQSTSQRRQQAPAYHQCLVRSVHTSPRKPVTCPNKLAHSTGALVPLPSCATSKENQGTRHPEYEFICILQPVAACCSFLQDHITLASLQTTPQNSASACRYACSAAIIGTWLPRPPSCTFLAALIGSQTALAQ